MDTSTLTVAALVALCKERRIRGYSGKSKADLVALLTAATAATVATAATAAATVAAIPVTTGPIALSLFSGAGGDTLGLERAGYTVVAFSEFKAPAIQTHQAAFPSSTLLQHAGTTDITALPDATFEPYRGRVQVLFNGSPCQSYSHAGKKNPDDPRNELIHQVMRVADIVQPPWILFENVRGLLSRTGRDPVTKTTRPVIDILKDLFDRHGYKITYRVLNTTSVGVAQVRQRLLLAAHRGPLYPRLPWPSEEGGGALPPIRPFLEAHLTDAMELPVAQIPADLPSRFWIHTDQTNVTGTPHPNLVRLVRGIRNASSKEKAAHPEGPAIIQEPGGLISFGVRKGGYHGEVMDPDRPSKTIICTYNLCPRLFVGLWNPAVNKRWVRCLTVRELAQIQGFPADYPWRGTTKEAIIQIGNAVPPPLVEHLAKALDHATFHAEPDYKGVGGEEDEEE